MKQTLILATQNRGKALEIERFFGGQLRVQSLAEHPQVELPEESGSTFAENARIKAEHVARSLGTAALGDDSGLEVDALLGAPGVRSARYAPGSDEDRYRKLLHALAGAPDLERGARFVCALAFAAPDQDTVICEGEVLGRIAEAPRGHNGFGYDPVFLPEAAPGRTMAELGPAEKQSISHRGEALRRIQPLVRKYFSLAGDGALP